MHRLMNKINLLKLRQKFNPSFDSAVIFDIVRCIRLKLEKIMKKLLVLLPLVLMTACAATGPAEDQFDEEDKEPKIRIDGILGKSSAKKKAKAKSEAENKALRARIERLENDRRVGGASNTNSSGSSNGGVSFREWSSAREKGSSEYDEFKEYQKWLEFKRYKEQSQK